MVGGWVIEVTGASPVKVWVNNPTEGECCVHVEPSDTVRLPQVGEEVWWQSGEVMFGGSDPKHGQLSLRKVGYSHSPEACRAQPARP